MSSQAPRRAVPPPPDTERAPAPICHVAPEPNTTVNLGAFLEAARDDGFPARSERPPGEEPDASLSGSRPARAPARRQLGAAIASLVLAVAVASIVAGRYAIAPRPVAKASSRAAATSSAQAAPAPAGGPCTAGERRVLAHGARLAAGLEASESGGRLAAAVSTSPNEARAVEVDAETLAPRAVTRLVTTRAVRRALPLLAADGSLDVEHDDGASFLGAGGMARVREARADAVRAAPLAGGVAAVVFRRDGAVWAQTSPGAGRVAVDGPVRLSEEGVVVGAPSVATTRVGDVLAAWAQRAGPGEAWSVRWTRWTPGGEPERPRAWRTPGMAPALAALPGGGTLLAWTDGDGGSHAVRAQVLGADGAPRGGVLDLSAAGSNAGQERVVLGPAGRGAAFFLEAEPDGRFALVARSISCQSL